MDGILFLFKFSFLLFYLLIEIDELNFLIAC